MIPPSESARPAMLCPPPRIESSTPVSRASSTVRTTSSIPAGRTTTAGRFWIIPFQICTASLYTSSPGNAATSRRDGASDSNSSLCRVLAPLASVARMASMLSPSLGREARASLRGLLPPAAALAEPRRRRALPSSFLGCRQGEDQGLAFDEAFDGAGRLRSLPAPTRKRGCRWWR